ncbi:hypothetical protein C8R44DRAFT_724695 [Mycena epipterygia]|nr:hypothetical protein C8R44DRAFT_724695 [Mycena epipterygia]
MPPLAAPLGQRDCFSGVLKWNDLQKGKRRHTPNGDGRGRRDGDGFQVTVTRDGLATAIGARALARSPFVLPAVGLLRVSGNQTIVLYYCDLYIILSISYVKTSVLNEEPPSDWDSCRPTSATRRDDLSTRIRLGVPAGELGPRFWPVTVP